MSRQPLAIILLCYFLFGLICLPKGNFAGLPDLVDMYRHCKAFEDKDMNAFDFVTDHLINIDGIFDDHGEGDEQRPHVPFTLHHATQTPVCHLIFKAIITSDPPANRKTMSIYPDQLYLFGFNAEIFRPPIA